MNRRAVDGFRVPYYSPSHPRGPMFRKINLIWEIPAKQANTPYPIGIFILRYEPANQALLDIEHTFDEAWAQLSSLAENEHPASDEGSLYTMLCRSVEFFTDTIAAIRQQLLDDRFPQAEVLCRPMFELSVRLMWAALTNEWRRLKASYVLDYLHWGANEDPEDAKHSQWLVDFLEQKYKEIPSVRQLLEFIDTKYQESEPKSHTPVNYTQYQTLCNSVHAHLFAIGTGPFPGRVTWICLHVVVAGELVHQTLEKTLG